MAVKQKATLVFETRVAAAEADIKRLTKGLGALGDKAEKGSGIMFAGYNAAGIALKGVLSVVGLIIKAFKTWMKFLVSTVKEFLKLDKAMREVATISDEVANNMGRYNSLVREFSSELGVSAERVAKGLYQTISAGITDANDAAEVLNRSLRFGVASLTDSQQAVDLVTTAMNAYKLEASEAERVTDVLFTTIRLGKTTGPELAGSLGRVIPIAAMAGVSLEDLSSAMVQMTRVGLSTDEAATSLRQILLSVIAPSQGAAKAIEELGLSTFNAGSLARSGGLFDALTELAGAAEDDLQTVADILPNIRALVGALGLMGDLKGVNEILGEISQSAGAVEKGIEELKKGAGFWFENIRNNWNETRSLMGEGFIQMLGVEHLEAFGEQFQIFTGMLDEQIKGHAYNMGEQMDLTRGHLRRYVTDLEGAGLTAEEALSEGAGRALEYLTHYFSINSPAQTYLESLKAGMSDPEAYEAAAARAADNLSRATKASMDMTIVPQATELGEAFANAFGGATRAFLEPLITGLWVMVKEVALPPMISAAQEMGRIFADNFVKAMEAAFEGTIMGFLMGFNKGGGGPDTNYSMPGGGHLGSGAFGMNEGGAVRAYGGAAIGGVDTVPAKLSAGEFVMRREAVDSVGLDVMEKLNRMGPATMNVNLPNVGTASEALAVAPRLASGFSRYGRIGGNR